MKISAKLYCLVVAMSLTVVAVCFAVYSHRPQASVPEIPDNHGPSASGPRILGWRMDGSSCYPDANPPIHWSVNHNIAWKVPIATDSYSSPVLIDEKVLTTAGPSTVICLDARDGSEIWRTANHYFKDVLGEDEVTEATAFCLNASGKLHALNVRNGEVRWARDYTSDFLGKIPTWGFSATPIVCDGTLVVSPGGGAGFVGLNPVNGEDLWEIETEEANYPSLTIRKSQGHNQAIGYDRDSLYGVNAEHGTVLWQLRVKNPRGYIVPQPALVNDKLLLIDQYSGARLHAFDDKGAIQQTPVAANRRLRTDLSTPHVVRNIVLVGAGCLTCADAQKLEVLWEQEDEESFAAEILHIVSHDGQTVVFSQDGHGLVIEADREGCTILAKAKLSEATFARPVFGSDCVYARDGKYLYCYGLKK